MSAIELITGFGGRGPIKWTWSPLASPPSSFPLPRSLENPLDVPGPDVDGWCCPLLFPMINKHRSNLVKPSTQSASWLAFLWYLATSNLCYVFNCADDSAVVLTSIVRQISFYSLNFTAESFHSLDLWLKKTCNQNLFYEHALSNYFWRDAVPSLFHLQAGHTLISSDITSAGAQEKKKAKIFWTCSSIAVLVYFRHTLMSLKLGSTKKKLKQCSE